MSQPPGSRAGLLPPSPLRTTRASFPACRSSLANALLRTRFHDGQSLAMDLGMTVRMKQRTVFGTVRAAMRAPHQMMAMPSGQLRYALLTDRTEAALLLPQANQVSSSPQVARHTHAQTGFEVWLPLRVIRIGFALNLRVPTNRHTGGTEQAHVLRRPMRMRDVTKEYPVVAVFGSEVLVPNPVAGFSGGSAPRPLPQ